MKRGNNRKFIGVIDVFFIMILCFATLLATMLVQGGVIVGGSGGGIRYDFHISQFAIVIGWMIAYFMFIIRHSNKELRLMVLNIYGKKNDRNHINL
ncbi:MAG: hypothetical protein ABFD98_13605 [Syntrophobacteraceae bacterium]|nr:hypothetical protein [Desulfobacteraceae bacterium]